ncbi:hypothetical protein ACFPRL_07505 [Pseudoclavibacter helvolus]
MSGTVRSPRRRAQSVRSRRPCQTPRTLRRGRADLPARRGTSALARGRRSAWRPAPGRSARRSPSLRPVGSHRVDAALLR